jgi:hypothetical protein
MNTCFQHGLGCAACNNTCQQNQVGAVPGVPDLADIGKKAAAALVLAAFVYITYKTFAS